jgi:hypothetical protein
LNKTDIQALALQIAVRYAISGAPVDSPSNFYTTMAGQSEWVLFPQRMLAAHEPAPPSNLSFSNI